MSIIAAAGLCLGVCRLVFADAGTVNLWAKPSGGANSDSQPIVTIDWPGAVRGRFVISQTRSHEPRFYVKLGDGRELSCSPRFKFPYTFFLPEQWTELSLTWQSDPPALSRWYMDGKILCESAATPASAAQEPTQNSDNVPTMSVERLMITPRAQSAEEIHRTYVRNGGNSRPKWAIALAGARPGAAGVPQAVPARRVMQDEDTHWSASKSEIVRRVQRLAEAGFNVYMPNVWNGARIFCKSEVAPIAPGILDPLDPSYDPLTYLIAEAHKRGIEVHPWMYVVGRQPGDGFPASFVAGSPDGAFNVHDSEFRDYIVALGVEIAKRHDIDGLNLDYVRAVGPCTNTACIEAYRRKYGRSLAEDWETAGRVTEVPSLMEFNRDAVTDIIARLSSSVRALRPRASLSVDSVLFDFWRSQQGLDEATWLKRGYIDAVVNMSYDDPVNIDDLDRAVATIGARHLIVNFRNYDIFGADVVDRSGAAMADYMYMVRSRWPDAGIGIYHYMHMDVNQLAGFRHVFAQVPPPRAN